MNLAPAPLTADERLALDRKNEKELTKKQAIYRHCANHRKSPPPDEFTAAAAAAATGAKKPAAKIDPTKPMKCKRGKTVGSESQVRRNQIKNLELLKNEWREVRTSLAVANGPTTRRQNDQEVLIISRHVRYQTELQRHIDEIRQQIGHMQIKLKRLDLARGKIAPKLLTELQYRDQMHRANANRVFLENRLEAFKHIEGAQIAKNQRLRELIKSALHARQRFSHHSQRTVSRLYLEKKYLLDQADRVVMAFNQGEALCKRLDLTRLRNSRDFKRDCDDMINYCRQLDADEKQQQFLAAKGKLRELCDLEAREYRRRDAQRAEHQRQMEEWQRIIDEFVAFQSAPNVALAKQTFANADAEYFSHFTYTNSLSFEIEFYGECQRKLYEGIDAQRAYSAAKQTLEANRIVSLQRELEDERGRTEAARQKLGRSADRLQQYTDTIMQLFERLGCSRRTLDVLLGDQRQAHQFNLPLYLQLLETRLNEVLAFVYAQGRPKADDRREDAAKVVRGVSREPFAGTGIEEVVLVQQCAECAEGDVNRYDEKIELPLAKQAILDKVREATVEPLIQFRLHRLSECRLPRSRNLVLKRYQLN